MNICKATIINKKNLKNSNLKLSLLTKELGHIKAVAYGGSAISKRFQGSLDLFKILELEIELNKKNQQIFYLISNKARTIKTFTKISKNLNKFYLANFILELSNMVIHENEIFSKNNKNYFDIIYNTLNYIDSTELVNKEFAAKFCLKFFKETGFIPEDYKLKVNKTLKHFILETIDKCPISIQYL